MPAYYKRPRNVSRSFGPLQGRSKTARPAMRRPIGPAVLRRRRRVRRYARPARPIGNAVMINPRRPRTDTVVKYVYNAFQAYNATLTSAGVGVLDSPVQYFIYQFDPAATAAAGTITTSNFHARVSGYGEEAGVTVPGSSYAFPDWGAYSGIYQFYKVNYVRVVHTLRTTETGDNLLFPTLYMRAFQAESLAAYTSRFGTFVATNTLNKMLEHTRVKKYTFNGDSNAMSISYKLYPRTWLNGIKSFVKQRWTPISSPVPLLGLVEVFEDPIPAGQLISTDLEWSISFKTRL